MTVSEETTIRLPVALRDQIRAQARSHGLRQADLLGLALRELQQAEFLRAVAVVDWDDEADSQEWDEADLAADLDPWQPTT